MDDHPILRNGLRAALSSEPGIRVLGEAGDGFEAEDKAIRLKPSVVIMDIFLQKRNGLDSLLSIKQKLPETKVLFFTMSEHEEHMFKAIRLGADGYILKKTEVEEVIKAVKTVAVGEAVLSPCVASKLMREIKKTENHDSLSSREQEVLSCITDGLSDPEIAGRLSISKRTVGSHVHRLLKKLHLKNRVEAATYFINRR